MIVLMPIGVGLIAAPLSMSMVSRSTDGQKMVNGFGFRPIMQPASVKTTAMYYNDVFSPLRKVVPAKSAGDRHALSRHSALAAPERLRPRRQPAHRGMGHRSASRLSYD